MIITKLGPKRTIYIFMFHMHVVIHSSISLYCIYIFVPETITRFTRVAREIPSRYNESYNIIGGSTVSSSSMPRLLQYISMHFGILNFNNAVYPRASTDCTFESIYFFKTSRATQKPSMHPLNMRHCSINNVAVGYH